MDIECWFLDLSEVALCAWEWEGGSLGLLLLLSLLKVGHLPLPKRKRGWLVRNRFPKWSLCDAANLNHIRCSWAAPSVRLSWCPARSAVDFWSFPQAVGWLLSTTPLASFDLLLPEIAPSFPTGACPGVAYTIWNVSDLHLLTFMFLMLMVPIEGGVLFLFCVYLWHLDPGQAKF